MALLSSDRIAITVACSAACSRGKRAALPRFRKYETYGASPDNCNRLKHRVNRIAIVDAAYSATGAERAAAHNSTSRSRESAAADTPRVRRCVSFSGALASNVRNFRRRIWRDECTRGFLNGVIAAAASGARLVLSALSPSVCSIEARTSEPRVYKKNALQSTHRPNVGTIMSTDLALRVVDSRKCALHQASARKSISRSIAIVCRAILVN